MHVKRYRDIKNKIFYNNTHKKQNTKEEIVLYKQRFEKLGHGYRSSSWDEGRKIKALERLGVFEINEPSILDFGCGTATYTPYLHKTFNHVIGLDVVFSNVKIAKYIDKPGDYVCGDGLSLPFKDASFDAVLCGQVLHHFPDIIYPVSELNRVLREDGFLFIIEPNDWNPLTSVRHRFPKKEYGYSHNEHSLGYIHMKNKLDDAGFVIIMRCGMNFAPANENGIWKLVKKIEPYLERLPLVNLLGGSLLITAKKQVRCP